MNPEVVVIGAGLAGSEAAWTAAENGAQVQLYEMRPGRMTPAHRSGAFAELVCSNSLGARTADRAAGLLQAELARLGALLVRIAAETAVPAGAALAVDRNGFAERVTECLQAHPGITVVREELRAIPGTKRS